MTHSLSQEAAEIWLRLLDNPVHNDIKKVGSMQRKFNMEDWADFIERIKG